MTKDLRTISSKEIEALRARAIEEVQKCHNISKVAGELGINRQVLYVWVNRFKITKRFDKGKRGRPKQNLHEKHTHKIIHTMANGLPSDQEIFGIFWTASSVRELICITFDRDYTAYFIRRWLLECGFFNDKMTNLFDESLYYMGGKTVRMCSDSYDMPCYVFWRASIKTIKREYRFQCVISKRGDIRFIGEDVRETSEFLNHLQYVARRKIIVVCDENCRISYRDIDNLSDNVVLIQKKQGKREVTHSKLK